MRFTISSILSLAALSSAAAVAPSADYGYWDFDGSVNFPVSGYTSWTVDATYHNSELDEPIAVHCTYNYNPRDRTETKACDDPSFSYDLGGVGQARTTANITLKQTVPLWGEQVTVQGTNEIKFDFSGGAGFGGPGSGKIDVQTAIA